MTATVRWADLFRLKKAVFVLGGGRVRQLPGLKPRLRFVVLGVIADAMDTSGLGAWGRLAPVEKGGVCFGEGAGASVARAKALSLPTKPVGPGGRCGVCLVCAVRLFAIQA